MTLRSRDIWSEVAAEAGIPILHRGLAMVARRPEARAVLEPVVAGVSEGLETPDVREATALLASLQTTTAHG